jgi:hypothetical protein
MNEITDEARTAYSAVLAALRWLDMPADPRVFLALDKASAMSSKIDGPHRGAIGRLVDAIAACQAQGQASSPELIRACRAASLLLSGRSSAAGQRPTPRR